MHSRHHHHQQTSFLLPVNFSQNLLLILSLIALAWRSYGYGSSVAAIGDDANANAILLPYIASPQLLRSAEIDAIDADNDSGNDSDMSAAANSQQSPQDSSSDSQSNLRKILYPSYSGHHFANTNQWRGDGGDYDAPALPYAVGTGGGGAGGVYYDVWLPPNSQYAGFLHRNSRSTFGRHQPDSSKTISG